MRLCINCKHFESVPASVAQCAEAKRRTVTISPVDGKPVYSLSYCEPARRGVGNNYCGPEGMWFEEREQQAAA